MSTVVSNDEARENIAANITRLLDARGWNQQDLADATGESKMTISNIVRGNYLTNAGTVARIAEALDVTVDRLISAPPEKISSKRS